MVDTLVSGASIARYVSSTLIPDIYFYTSIVGFCLLDHSMTSYIKSLYHLYKTHLHFVRHIDHIGAVMPTSGDAVLYMKELIDKYIDAHGHEWSVLELGPGTGNITKHLLQTSYQVHAIELDEVFVDTLSQQYQTHSNFKLYHDSAINLRNHIHHPVDIIVTTIPMTLLGDVWDRILEQCAMVLKPWWMLISGQIRSKQEKQYQHHIGPRHHAKLFLGLQPIRVTSFVKADV